MSVRLSDDCCNWDSKLQLELRFPFLGLIIYLFLLSPLLFLWTCWPARSLLVSKSPLLKERGLVAKMAQRLWAIQDQSEKMETFVWVTYNMECLKKVVEEFYFIIIVYWRLLTLTVSFYTILNILTSRMLYILTSIWVLHTKNAGSGLNMHFKRDLISLKKFVCCNWIFVNLLKMHISTCGLGAQHPNTGRNIQHKDLF